MVCLGNICRSPIAEGILQNLINIHQLNWTVESANTNGLHNGEAPHKNSQRVCLEHGIDISHQRSRKFTKADWQNFDKIYVMADDVLADVQEISAETFDENKIDYLLNEIYPKQNKNVKDPWYCGLQDYYDVYDEIEKACLAIKNKY